MKITSRPVSNQSGQATLELSLSSGLILVAVMAGSWLIKAEWDRARCAHLVFQKTHDQLTQERHSPLRFEVKITESDQKVRGQKTCGKSVETVELPKLQAL